MSVFHAEFIACVAVTAAMVAFVGFRLAVADGVAPNVAWGWAELAGAATVVDLGVLYDAVDPDRGVPSLQRIGAVGLGVLCAVGVAVVAYALAGPGSTRGRRWCATGGAFSVAMAVFAVVLNLVG